MGRPKADVIQRTGGFRVGEPAFVFRGRVAEIRNLEQALKTGRVKGEKEVEKMLRRLCQLKDIYFDGYDPPDD